MFVRGLLDTRLLRVLWRCMFLRGLLALEFHGGDRFCADCWRWSSMEVIAFSRGLLALEFHGGDRFFPWIVGVGVPWR